MVGRGSDEPCCRWPGGAHSPPKLGQAVLTERRWEAPTSRLVSTSSIIPVQAGTRIRLRKARQKVMHCPPLIDPSTSSWQSPPMTAAEALKLLEKFRQGRVSSQKVLQAFQSAPLVDLGFAQVDTHRAQRQGFPEVVFAQGKTPAQVARIVRVLRQHNERVLVTRVNPEQVRAVRKSARGAVHHETARCLTIDPAPLSKNSGKVAVLCAGTSDLPVAEEAAVTADIMGNSVERLYDVGVSGIHRLLRKLDTVQSADVLIVVAGMEGALPSVVAGLVRRPVIAVPTSIGYGANFGGMAALLAMLNSCGSGVTVVNIDNGFGAGFAASQIMSLAAESKLNP